MESRASTCQSRLQYDVIQLKKRHMINSSAKKIGGSAEKLNDGGFTINDVREERTGFANKAYIKKLCTYI